MSNSGIGKKITRPKGSWKPSHVGGVPCSMFHRGAGPVTACWVTKSGYSWCCWGTLIWVWFCIQKVKGQGHMVLESVWMPGYAFRGIALHRHSPDGATVRYEPQKRCHAAEL